MSTARFLHHFTNIALSFDMYKTDANKEDLDRAITLAKADLMSEMVYEFTELQGLMGYYYAKEAGERLEDGAELGEEVG